MNIKKLYEKTSAGFKEFVAKVDFANVIGLSEELDKYLKYKSDKYVSFINPDIEYNEETPKINIVYGNGRVDSIFLDLANTELPGLMSAKDKVKLDTLESKINSNHIRFVDFDNDKYYLDLTYNGIILNTNSNKYIFQDDDCTISANDINLNGNIILKNKEVILEKGLHVVSSNDDIVTTRLNIDTTGTDIEEVLKVDTTGIRINTYQDDDVTIASNNLKINRGDRNVTLTADELIFNDTSTNTYDNSYSITTIGNGSIKYKYKINTAVDGADVNAKEQNFTYTFPDKSGTIELVDEEKDAKLKQISNLGSNQGYRYSTSFESFEKLVEYVKNNTTTEQYMGFIDNESTSNILLAKDGTLMYSLITDYAIGIAKGTVDFETGDITDNKFVTIDLDRAILPNDIYILDDIDNTKAYNLNIAKCLELGILTEVNINSRSKKFKTFNLLNLKQ